MIEPHVLIIEDDENICSFLEATLSLWNINAETLINPLLFSDEIKRKFYNIIIVDISIEEINSIDIILEIQKTCPDTKTIILTGHADKELAIKTLSMGAFDFLEKPITMDLLYCIVKRALDIQRTEREHKATLAEFGEKSQELMETLEALSVLLKNIEIAQQEMGKMLATQLKALLAPLIDNLQHEKNATVSTAQLAALSSYVDNLTEDAATGQPAHFSLSALSLREMQIARLIKNYMTNEEIAAQLYISPETVRTHRRNIRKKLGIRGTKARLHGHLLTLSGNALATDLAEPPAPSNGNHRHMLCATERLSIMQEMGVVG